MDTVYPQYDTFLALDGVDLKAEVPGLSHTRPAERDGEAARPRLAQENVRKVLGENWLRVFRETL